MDAETLEIMETIDTGSAKTFNRRPTLALHRVDLHKVLRDKATGPEPSDTIPPVIHLGHQVEQIDCEAGVLTLEGGRTVQKDLLVVADGVHVSRFYSSHLIPVTLSAITFDIES